MSASTNDVANFVVKISILPFSYEDLISARRPFPFRPGMSATVEIITAVKTESLSIPSGAVALRVKQDSADRNSAAKKEE